MPQFLWVMALSALLVVLSILIHYESMRLAADLLLPRLTLVPRRAHVAFGVIACFVAHTIEVWMFAGVYAWLSIGAESGFEDDYRRHFVDYLYFSTETYTSLGFGEVTVLSHDLRLLAGVEAMVGLVLIAWTASFSFFLMERYWREHPAHRRADHANTVKSQRDRD